MIAYLYVLIRIRNFQKGPHVNFKPIIPNTSLYKKSWKNISTFVILNSWNFKILKILLVFVNGVKIWNVGMFFDSGDVQSNSSSSNKFKVLGDKQKSTYMLFFCFEFPKQQQTAFLNSVYYVGRTDTI